MTKIKALIVLGCLFLGGSLWADENAYFAAGPLSLNLPLKTVRAVYLYDFLAVPGEGNKVGGETPLLTLWNRLEGTFGVVTSLNGNGAPFAGGNILIGNVMDRWVSLPQDLTIGGFGGYNFRTKEPMVGLKASYKLWD